jgi:hypothetical protein
LGEQAAGGLDPVEVGHLDVNEGDVGLELAGRGDGFGAVCCFADHLEVPGRAR